MDPTHEKPEEMHVEGKYTNVSVADNTDVGLDNPEQLKGDSSLNLRLDKRGLPLVPQPTPHKDDPLVSRVVIADLVSLVLTYLRTGLLCLSSSWLFKLVGLHAWGL